MTDSGFKIAAKSRTDTVSFDQIDAVFVYKIDQFTADLICCDISFVSDGVKLFWTVHEELPGFDALMARLRMLPGFKQDWYETVAQPAFAENRTVVFQRGGAGA